MGNNRYMHDAVTGWMVPHGEHSDIVMSTRIRLARNLRGFRFPIAFSDEQADEVGRIVSDALLSEGKKGYSFTRMNDLESLERQTLVEKHLISPQLAKAEQFGAVLLSDDETISIMVNEEDHLRIQCIYPGMQLENAYNKADETDNLLENKLPYAFDEQFGYLTSCPSNTGTGLRASVMLHLPALTMTRQINRIIPAISRLGMVVRGSYGEGSEAPGNVYQVSNQLTLGKTEKEILAELANSVSRLISLERKARELLVEKSRIALENRVFRALGTISYARLLPSSEAARCLSDVRLGIDLGLIEDVDMNILNELMIFMQTGFLQHYEGEELTSEELDISRAKLFRERLERRSSETEAESDTDDC
ncbi:protein arginine kinase [Sporosarcina aquimarina]|uniref:Protein-arginine kinase n=2 Tax=Sporosarcina aquimarina TaxID=114975 RepID=A0ABU4FZ19_9BACL|nr:protein arginine kinase [Sporosarcina aquimarina]MDW0109963.1 protein arginine kinase [Sporosarcina aquimarina]